jgi:dipeptidyl aminopeptidase/acylaminoacyl peptidase
VRLSDVQWDSDGQHLVWLEGRATGGMLVCLALDSGDAPRDLTPTLSVSARVGYGGGEFGVAGGSIFFSAAPGRLYRQSLQGGTARPITPAFGKAAAPTVSPGGAWVLFVHSYEETDVLALVDAQGQQWSQRLVAGHDFYMQPRWHPDGQSIAYIAWNHPQMPWDGTRLYLARLHTHGPQPPHVAETQVIAGSDSVAIFQPEFSPDGRWLAYVSDESGWGHLYVYDLQQGHHHQLTHGEYEHGTPAWVQGMRSYGWCHDSRALRCIRNEQGRARLYGVPVPPEASQPPELLGGLEGYSWLSQPAPAPTSEALALVASASTCPPRLVLLSHPAPVPAARQTARILRRSQAELLPPASLSEARPVTWESTAGTTVYGMLYLPAGMSPTDITTGRRPLPPAIVRVHGGPTGQAVASFSNDVQFFTTRGYIVLMVNHRGSTGYGRAYMQALRENWGICDIEDTISAAHYLAAQGLADAGRIVVMGGSSGGYTVLETLCRAPGVFKAGICMYGISNLFTLTVDTHKFEAHYLDTLVGPLPDASDIYRERSPVFHAHLLHDPVAIFQGEADQVVPRAQSDAIVAALKRSGIPHEYHVYEGEGHGWRRQETIERFYQAVEAFLRQYVLLA